QILDDAGTGLEPTSAHSVGALYALYEPAAGKESRPAGRFNAARICLRDGRLEHWLNGAKVVECDPGSDDFRQRVAASKFNAYEGFGTVRRGHIALQDHGNDVWFRNIRIRDLDAPMPGEVKIFNGRDLTGWTAHLPEGGTMDEVWRVEGGILICKGQPVGYLRTTDDFVNYVLKLEWRFDPVTKKAGNSGVLLRMVGEDKVWPRSVEAQLHSGNAGDFWNIGEVPMKSDPDRTRGRNTKKTHFAERPVGEWNEYEIIVDGSSVVLKVNGQTVNEAWDVQEIPGKICLQSEGAEIHFRNIRLSPIKR
ncbi:MAG: 3-keto-disaccharide hydrolase, partial [Planctomycetota bacterium]